MGDDAERRIGWFRCTPPCHWSGEREIPDRPVPWVECPWCGHNALLDTSGQEKISAEEFNEGVERDRPDRLTASEVARVSPPPWFTRHGSGQRARIRLPIGDLKYERRQGEDVWTRVDEWTMGAPR